MPTPIGPTFRGRSGRYFQEVEGPGGFWLTLFACVIGGLFLLMALASGAHLISGFLGRVLVFLLSSVILNLLLFVLHWGGLVAIACGAVLVLWFGGTLLIDRLRGRAGLRQVIELLTVAVPTAAFAVGHYLIFEHHGSAPGAHATAFHTLVVRFEHVLALLVLPGALWVIGTWLTDLAASRGVDATRSDAV